MPESALRQHLYDPDELDEYFADGALWDRRARLAEPNAANALASQAIIERLPLASPERSTLAEALKDLQSLRAQVSQARDRERAWRAVSDTARDLTVLRDPERVLKAIVERGRALLAGHVAWIAGADSNRNNESYVLAIDGVSSEWAQQMRAGSSCGAAGYVRRTRSPFSSSDYFADERLIHDPTLDASLRREGVCSMIAVPMLSGSDFMGVLVVADRTTREYTHPDIAALSTLASHAVVAMRNATAFAQTQAALLQAEHSNDALQQKTAALELAADAHERLARIVAQGGGIADVCRTVAALLGATVCVVDAAGGLLNSALADRAATSDSGVGPMAMLVSDAPLRSAIDASRIAARSIVLTELPVGECRVAAIVGGNSLLGAIISVADRPLSDTAVRTLERSALVLAIILLAPDAKHDALLRRRDALLIDLLNPLRAGSTALARQAAAAGLDDSAATVLALIASDRAGTASLLRRLRLRLVSRRILIEELDGQIVILSGDHDPQALGALLKPLLLEKPGPFAGAVVSTPCGNLAALPASLASLQRCRALLEKFGRAGGVRLESQLSPYAAAFASSLAGTGDASAGFIDATIGPLLAHDRQRRAQLAPSLLAYLNERYNAKSAARRLGVHVNTLNHRLEAAQALLGSWEEPGRGLELHLALALNALLQQP